MSAESNHPGSEARSAGYQALGVVDRLRRLAKDSVVYGSAAALNKAFALITFPLLARHFSLVDYGVVDLFSFIIALLAILLMFGQDSAVARFLYEQEDDLSRSQVVSQALALQCLLLMIAIPVMWWSSDRISQNLSSYPRAGTLLRTALLQLPFLVFASFAQGLLRWTFERTRYLVISVGAVALNTTLLVIGVFWFDLDVVGVFQVALAVQAVFAALGLMFIKKWLVWPNGIHMLRRMLPYAIPYGIICSIGAVVPMLERLFVSTLIGGEELGLYAAGAKVAMLLSLLIFAFQSGWGPFSLAIHKDPLASRTYNIVLKVFSMGICVAVLGLSALAQPIITVLATDRFEGAGVVVFPLAMGAAIMATSWITEIGISISKRSHLHLFSYGAFLLSAGLAIVLLTRNFGMIGVAFGVMIGQAVLGVTATWLAWRAYPMHWEFKGAAQALLFTLLFGLVATWVRTRYGALPSSLTFAAGAILLPILGWCVILNSHERSKILGYIYKTE